MAKTPTKIASLARQHTERAIQVLVGVMTNEDAPAAARVKASEVLMDRGWGKAPQTMDMNLGAQDSLAELMREIGERGRTG